MPIQANPDPHHSVISSSKPADRDDRGSTPAPKQPAGPARLRRPRLPGFVYSGLLFLGLLVVWEITVKVLRIDDDKQKISLGLKQLMADPWLKVGDTYIAGQLRRGRVTRVADFGVFVELEPGIEGLIPLSESGVSRDGDVKKAFPIGNTIDVVLLDIDTNLRRIRLSVTAVQKMREADEVREYTERTDVAPGEGFGSLANKLRDALGPREK